MRQKGAEVVECIYLLAVSYKNMCGHINCDFCEIGCIRGEIFMHCPSCRTEAVQGDVYCRHCGTDLVETSTSIVPVQSGLPAILNNSPLPRRVAAGVGALALGVGIELLRRNVLARMSPSRSMRDALPARAGLKDVIFSRPDRTMKLPKGYEVHETVIYMTRVIRRQG